MMSSTDPLQASGDEEKIITHEQTKLLYEAMPSSIAATSINACILTAVQWTVIDHTILLAWLATLLLVTGLRGSLSYAYHRQQPTMAATPYWSRWFTVGAAVAGTVWGSTAIWLFPTDNIGHQVFLAFVIAGMSAGGSTSLSFQRAPVIIFLLLLLLPLSGRFFLLEGTLPLAMSAMTLLFMVILVLSSLKNHANTRQNISLRIQASQREEALRQSEGKYRHIFNSAPLGIMHYDHEGRITDFNETFARIMNQASEQILNLNLLRDTASKPLQSAIRQSLQGKCVDLEATSESLGAIQDLDLHLFCAGIESRQGIIHGGVAIVVDVSEEKRVERMKNQFISTVSHELRTPLTAIHGAIGLLHGNVAGEMSGKAHELLAIARKNTLRLQALINDILDIDKIDSGAFRLHLQAVEVRGFVEEALRISDHFAKEFGIQLVLGETLEYGTYVHADHGRLMQIMSNLISNATKFSPENSQVEIGTRREGNQVCFYVRDHGPGIPEEFQPMLYERFTQADGSNQRRNSGTGLGLSITRLLVERHGGNIRFETGATGTVFFVSLPRATDLEHCTGQTGP